LYAYSEISQPGALIRIKGKRHSGKTSFMSRLIASANSLGYKTITINFHTVETQNFESIKIFWKWFCRYLAREIELPDRLSEYWDDDDGPNTNCFFYLEKYLLVQESRSLLLAFDRIDHIINYPQVANEFFCLFAELAR
ncbi:AAA-like domain-containing protein, partial [Anaplasma marginale]|uniref:AAA-like domain-containing protein n=1 Tax=Anaplasma marginale TaxID=770 RepID=UPI0018E99534